MSDNEQVEFKVMLAADWWDEKPNYQLLIDDDIIESGFLEEKNADNEQKVIQFSKELSEGEHVLKVRLLNKSQIQTMVDESGNILKDQLLHIKQIEIDEIELDYLLWSHSFFHHFERFENGNPIFKELPDENKYPTTGFNGEYRLYFSVPTYMWFLENL